ncbi:carbonic anhydrase 4a [Hoplias malabaricus]|uniref:carbonic anhydrase 4a n=1 Tax=Hoplias malabaricus TaxID=27720 RepID=UPI00346265F7
MMLALISSFLLALLLNTCTGAEWCYQSQVSCEAHCKGPDLWEKVHTDCKGNKQSPINIVTKKTRADPRLTPLKFSNYQLAVSATMKNNGHSVKISLPHTPTLTISGGNLKKAYKAVQFHFHWGDNGGPGSEHTIDGEQYPMEMHIVHMREDFNSLDEALKERDGVAVLGFFYEESNSANRKYEGFIKTMKNVQNTNASAPLLGLSLSTFILPEGNMTNYYRYDGSLTTPTCTEAVVWTVFENPIPLSREQLSEFSKLKFSDGKDMVKTFRPVQPRKGRVVYRSSSAVLLASFTLLLLCVTSALGLSQIN